MYFASRKQKQERAILQENVAYPEASIKEYLNMRRTTKDKCCMITFCIYVLVILMVTGFGFFYGNFNKIGTLVVPSGPCDSSLNLNYISGTTQTCLTGCPDRTIPYLQKICVSTTYNPSQSLALASQIQIYNLKTTFTTLLFVNVGILVSMIFLFSLLVCFQKLIYIYIFLTFVIMLGFSFYLLKSIDIRLMDTTLNIEAGSIFYQDEKRMTGLAYSLLAAYLLFFPIILFSPLKIKISVNILSNMYKFFEKMFTIMLFTCLIAIVAYGILFLSAFLLMNIFTDGDPVINSQSFFYLYEKVYLSHPALLTFIFFGIYWLFGTLISWHKFLVGSSVCQWYFEDGGKMKPVRRGFKRAWYHLGSAAIDCLFTPLEWLILLIYSLTKMNVQTIQKYENEHHDDCLCFSNCLYSFRMLINRIYCKINRNASATGVLTNHTFIESCQIGAVTFAENNHKFFNIGGSLTLFLTLFSTLIWIFVNYMALYYNVYNKTYPPQVSSLALPILFSAFLGIVIGQIMSNVFTASIDCLLFCFLLEKKHGVQYSENEIKKVLEEIYTQEEQNDQVLEMYEIQTEQ